MAGELDVGVAGDRHSGILYSESGRWGKEYWRTWSLVSLVFSPPATGGWP